MIQVDLNDTMLIENLEAIQTLRATGLYTDEQLQEMYDEQVKADKEKVGDTE
jgi:hypothetical protein